VVPKPTEPVIVIGDIHGRYDLLTVLLRNLRDEPTKKLIFVGDYIDRGEQSRAVLKTLMTRTQTAPKDTICLKGNHEQMMLDFLQRPQRRGRRWLRNGGLQTLSSYGIGGLTPSSPTDHVAEAAQHLRRALGGKTLRWLATMPTLWRSGNVAVVHAAADPNCDIDAQDNKTLIWGHERFLNNMRTDNTCVVHGHTVFETPVHTGSRISIDTGAYFSNTLTAAVIDPSGTVRFVQT
jgi:serine/threonine protein phosphatase 1